MVQIMNFPPNVAIILSLPKEKGAVSLQEVQNHKAS